MSKEEIKKNQIPVYTVEEEDEEETMTIDFENKKVYSKEETLIVKNGESISKATINGGVSSIATMPFKPVPPFQPIQHINFEQNSKPVEPTFKSELQDVLLNTVTSKAIGSLLKKHYNLDTEIDKLMYNNRMGKLGSMIDSEIDSIMEKRRKELRNCYSGNIVKYEHIPEWAHTYIKEYTRDMIHSMSILMEDEGI